MVSGSRVPASRLAALSPSPLQPPGSGFGLRLAIRARMTRWLIEPHCSAAS
jgi:hypothetical protein